MKTLTDPVITFCSCTGSQFSSDTRFLQPRLVALGHVGFAQQVVIPAMKRQGTATLILWQPFGISRQMNDDGKWEPVDLIEFDARRLCNDNPLTKHVANIRDMNKAIDLYHAAGITVGHYLGSPRDPRFAAYTTSMLNRLVSAVVTPFKYSVDFWALDELAESTGPTCVLGEVELAIEAHSGTPCLGEPRPLRGKALPRRGAFVEGGKWKSSKGSLGDRYHLGVHELPKDYPLYVIDCGETVTEVKAILASGARFAMSPWTNKTVSQLTAKAATS